MAFISTPAFLSLRLTKSHSSRRPRRPIVQARAKASTRQRSQGPSPPQFSSNPDIPAQAAITYLQSLGISSEDSRRAISRHPRLASQPDFETFAAPTITYLRDTLGLDGRLLARTVRNAPQILYRSRDGFDTRLEFLDNVARISKTQLPHAIAKCPHVLWMDLRAASEVVACVVEACPRITPASLGNVFGRVPQALITSPTRIRSNIDNIRVAGVTDSASMARIFAKAPLTLVYDAKKTIGKRLQYLSDELGLSEKTVGKVVVSTPEVLEWSVAKMLKPRVELLESLVGEDAIASVIDKVPSLFGIEDILDRVLWLRDDVGLDDTQIRTVLREAPAILTYSVVGNLAPKWTFVHETMGGARDDLVAAPREVLCANLQQRAMPRYAFLASNGTSGVPVVDILRGSDTEFCRNVAKCDPDTFRAYVDNDTYLLFFSQLV